MRDCGIGGLQDAGFRDEEFAGWGDCGIIQLGRHPIAEFLNAGLNTALSKCGIAVLLTLSLV